MKATLNILKVTALGLTILFGTQSAFAQKGESTSPKDVIKTEQSGKDKIKTGETTEGTQTGGKDDLKNGSTSGKDDLKNGNTSGKDDIKNGTEETEGTEGSVEGSHEGHAHKAVETEILMPERPMEVQSSEVSAQTVSMPATKALKVSLMIRHVSMLPNPRPTL